MTSAFTLAATHGGSIPSPVTILVAVAAIGYVLWSRMKGQPLRARRLLVLPVILIIIGVTDMTGSSAPHLSPTDITFLVISVVVAAVLGAARGATIELYPNQGELWQRYRPSTVVLWIALIVIKVVLLGVASATGASAGGGTHTLLVSLGASLLAEAAIVGPRALSTGLPFAPDKRDTDAKRSGPPQSPSSLAPPFVDLATHRDRSGSNRRSEETHRAVPSPDDAGQWRSPSIRDGVDWLRRQIGESASRDR